MNGLPKHWLCSEPPLLGDLEDAAIHEGAAAIQLPDDHKIEWLFDDKRDEGKG